MDCIKSMKFINIGDMIPDTISVLSTRKAGEIMRHMLKLDELDVLECVVIHIFIPDRFLSINSSFFLGCFEKSVHTLGKLDFKAKYFFKCDKTLNNCIEDGIRRALLTRSEVK